MCLSIFLTDGWTKDVNPPLTIGGERERGCGIISWGLLFLCTDSTVLKSWIISADGFLLSEMQKRPSSSRQAAKVWGLNNYSSIPARESYQFFRGRALTF